MQDRYEKPALIALNSPAKTVGRCFPGTGDAEVCTLGNKAGGSCWEGTDAPGDCNNGYGVTAAHGNRR